MPRKSAAKKRAPVGKSRVKIDPVSREIVKNALSSVADSMAFTVVRTARSSLIKDGMDFSTAIFLPDGQQVAQSLTLPAHLGSMMPALAGIIKAFGEDVHPEDVFINNDPYEGGSHLPDFFIFKPVFKGKRLLAWTCAIGHQTDVGGRVAGGVVCDNTELYQEGLILPPTKLYDRGKLNKAVWRIIEKNVRVPDTVLGDVRALMAAARYGDREFLRLVDEYGEAPLNAYMIDILDTSEKLTRNSFRALPKGEWEFTDYIDSDGLDPQPIAIKCKIRIVSDEVEVDFTGTSPAARGSINVNLAYTWSQVYSVLKCLIDPEIPCNAGFFRPFKVTAPEGCFVNPRHPSPVASRGMSGLRVCHALFGAMAKALPDKVPAAWGGGEAGVSFSGRTADHKAWVHLNLINDGPRGGGPEIDGADGLAAPINNMANIPIEGIEAEQPVLIERYELVADTGGAGKFRGGLAISRDFRVLADNTAFQLRSDRKDFPAYGVRGGRPGTPTRSYLNPQSENRELASKCLLTLNKGDLYRLIQASGGGYGDPLDRAIAAVLDDVAQEKLTVDAARADYGVVIDARGAVDSAATDKLRAEMRSERRSAAE